MQDLPTTKRRVTSGTRIVSPVAPFSIRHSLQQPAGGSRESFPKQGREIGCILEVVPGKKA